MIELTMPPDGRKVFLAPAAIAKITEAGAPSQYRGIRAYVKTFDGETHEVCETCAEIVAKISAIEI